MTMFFDPASLAVISLWGGIAAGVAAPVALAARAVMRFRGRSRNAKNRCARCAEQIEAYESAFVFDGLRVCDSCANDLRVALEIGLPAAAAGVVGLGLLSSIGLLLGSPAIWTFNGIVVPPLLVGLAPFLASGGGVTLLVQLVKRANRRALATGTERTELGAEEAQFIESETG